MTYLKALAFIAERGVEVVLLSETKFKIGGFYKSGDVVFDAEKNTITARYNEVEQLYDYSDLIQTLIELNVKWHDYSKDRHGGWKDFDESWKKVKQDYNVAE